MAQVEPQLVEPRPLFLLFLDVNDRNMTKPLDKYRALFYRGFYFFFKINFLTKFQKLASERYFDLHPYKAIFTLFSQNDKNKVR
jgi:hypothetical protein